MWQKAKNIYHLLQALGSSLLFSFPSKKLVVIGVTGTSGKTTTTSMIYEILKAAGYKVSMISTIKAVIAGKEYDTGFHVTTPDPVTVQKFLAQAAKHGDTHFVMEVSSHRLDQNIASFVDFDIGVLTTLAHEHLDYHKTMENYAKAKLKLLKASRIAVLPANGIPNELWEKAGFGSITHKMTTFGIDEGDETQKKWNLRLKMPGSFNLHNGLAAATVGKLLNVESKTIRQALEHISALPGRFEEVKTSKKFRVIIDFAHKPDALEQLLIGVQSVRKRGRIITLFGCASERDTQKRPMMGEISGELSDITVLTDEDPRNEDSMKIINEITDGCVHAGAVELSSNISDLSSEKRHVFYKIPNRKEAIKFVLRKLVRPYDIVLLCGKGHETSMNYKGKELPWSEHKAVEEALRKAV